MKVLVTGGNGFIGGWVALELEKRGHEAVILDRVSPRWSTIRARRDRYEHVLADVRDASAVFEAVGHVDGVIHLAAVLGSQETIANPRPAIEVNLFGAVNVMEACVQHDIPMTMTSVGNAWLRSSGAGTYTIVKECAADLFEMYRTYRGLNGNLVRPTNAYGPGQSVHWSLGGHSCVRKILPTFINQALQGKPIEVYGDGEQISDMVWVGDVAKVLVSAVQEARGLRLHATAEVGPEESLTVNEVANAVLDCVTRHQTKHMGWADGRITHLPMRAGERKGVTKADTSTLKPYNISLTPFAEGLSQTVEYYRHAK